MMELFDQLLLVTWGGHLGQMTLPIYAYSPLPQFYFYVLCIIQIIGEHIHGIHVNTYTCNHE